MKTTFGLLVALALSSPMALAQGTPPAQIPPGTPAQSDLGMPSQPGITSPSTSGTSGPATESESGGSVANPVGSSNATSGASGTAPVNHAGSSTDISSGGPNPMQSEAGMELAPAPPVTARLQPVVQNDVTYLCGGVGEEEVSYMKNEAKGYDLMLTFAAKSGAYLADVKVDIKDAKGESVLQASCDSPILLVDLPRSGTYRVHADAAGYALNKTVKVAAARKKGQHLASAVLVWPQRVAEAEGTATTSSGSGASDNAGKSGGATGTSDSGSAR
ncbi:MULTISPECIES: hypothetical protein [Oxalobacteraceae]|jgi:hypothetical protein|uniref:hypothetical protein n=1 Tax=Oxalobacteraceae TaxID=75682 RepID=UPI0010A3DE44|nr:MULTISPECIES: hypothetical protein [Oxalobacteraceae]